METSNDERYTGKVLWFSNGIGFICPDGHKEGDNDVFFHFTQIVMANEGDYKTVEPDEVVSFGIGQNHKGSMAIEIKKESAAEQQTEAADEAVLV
jgi:cold shock CspA family protein